jgi:3-deoxy-D-manno-octulosonic-acid transferase
LGETIAPSEPVSILDTIGELGTLWNLARLAYVGGSLDGKRGGQNMIEPAALGLVPVFGPHVWNFQAIANALVSGDMADKVANPEELLLAFREQLRSPERFHYRGEKAKEFVESQQGATRRTVDMLSKMIPVHSQ